MPHPKDEKKSIEFLDVEFYAESLKKKICQKPLLDPENCQCGHQQPYNFFSVFGDFRTFSDNSGKPK